jgi:proline iminopeptidase
MQARVNQTELFFTTFGQGRPMLEITVPTLVMAGRDDWITPPREGAERLHAALPNSERVVFEDSGHFPFIEEQARFQKIVGEWIARLA